MLVCITHAYNPLNQPPRGLPSKPFVTGPEAHLQSWFGEFELRQNKKENTANNVSHFEVAHLHLRRGLADRAKRSRLLARLRWDIVQDHSEGSLG